MCQANAPGHWLDAAQTPDERQRREAVLRALFRQGNGAMDGATFFALVREWPR